MTGLRPSLKKPLDHTRLVLPEGKVLRGDSMVIPILQSPSLCLPVIALQTHIHFTEAFSREACVSSLRWRFCLYCNTSTLYLDLKEPANLHKYGLIFCFYFPVPRRLPTACIYTELLLSLICFCKSSSWDIYSFLFNSTEQITLRDKSFIKRSTACLFGSETRTTDQKAYPKWVFS